MMTDSQIDYILAQVAYVEARAEQARWEAEWCDCR